MPKYHQSLYIIEYDIIILFKKISEVLIMILFKNNLIQVKIRCQRCNVIALLDSITCSPKWLVLCSEAPNTADIRK